VFASGNTLAGVWVQGDDGDKFNSFINVESIWNDARDVELGTGALDNTFTNVRVKLPVAASILDFGTRTTFINMMGHNGPGVFGFDSNSIVGPSLVLDRESLSPNTGDFLGTVIFSGRNGAAAVVQYSRIVGEISDIAGGAERGRLAVVTLELGAEAITALFEGPADGNTALSLRRNVGGSFAMSTVSMGDTDSGGSGYRLLRVPN
jgi:hypothetical protein